MNNKVNLKARINRHSRIFRENIVSKNIFMNKRTTGYNFVLFVMIFLIPIYPTLTSFAHGNSAVDFYRGDIDESSILGVYYGEFTEDESAPILELTDSFLSINTLLDSDRNLLGTNEIINYEVKHGESFGLLARKFNVSVNSILWANDFSSNEILHPGDVIKIPPVTGVLHKVKSGDTILGIASKYDIDMDKILEQNLLSSKSILKAGDVIIVPGAVKKKKVVAKIDKAPSLHNNKIKKPKSNSTGGYSFAKSASSSYVAKSGKYKLVWRKPKHTFYWGNCTWYVGQYKDVNWGGNAKDWIKNARKKGRKIINYPKIGSIIVFHGRGYNPRYGHVGIVMDVKGSDIIVSDMNYRRLGEITYRKVPINNSAIIGYIDVN
ncbi:hypothetical protein CSB07_00870 [Candidatus Gracilibacteria bacterium]|nr:MAG: hypothetical protein CSB07_00870 [Candidatus Gracilibacteria bacterium]PIE84999.1 MAG: hypothetical protein CSA08_04100 [Candidatus Gracilibacteria bacterium]